MRVLASRLISEGRANTNYAVTCAGASYVLRLYIRDPMALAKETQILRLLADRIPVPRVAAAGTLQTGTPFSVHSFVHGTSLASFAMGAPDTALSRAARHLGAILAELTQVPFETAGDLVAEHVDGQLRVEPWSLEAFYEWCLFQSPAGERLGPLRNRVWDFVRAHAGSPAMPRPHLVHGDFNPTNILVDEAGAVTGVLDWEFAHAGRLWSDIGNILRDRPNTPLPPSFADGLAAGLTAEGFSLPPDWRDLAEIDDLSSACEFLSSTEDRPETHAAALRQVERTLARLDS